MFKVGDVVKIKPVDEIKEHEDCVEEMYGFAEKLGIVESITESEYAIGYRIALDNCKQIWYDYMIEHDIEDEMMGENIDE